MCVAAKERMGKIVLAFRLWGRGQARVLALLACRQLAVLGLTTTNLAHGLLHELF